MTLRNGTVHFIQQESGSRVLEVVAATTVVDSRPAMFPGIVRTGDDLLVSFSTVPDGWPGGQVWVVRSADDGRTWQEPQLVAVPSGGQDAVLNAVGLTALSDGTLLLPYNGVTWPPGEAGTGSRALSVHLLRSTDGGGSWQGGEALHLGFHGPCVYGSMVDTGDGRILWPIWGQQRSAERWRSVVVESTDGGVTWSLGATLGFDPDARLASDYAEPAAGGLTDHGRPDPSLTSDPAFRPHSPIDGFSETTILRLPGADLVAVLRQQGVSGDQTLRLFTTSSTDSGRTWTEPRMLPFSGMSPLLHLTSSGELLLATRRHVPIGSGIRPGIEVRLGSEAAQEWSEPFDLVEPNGSVLEHEYQCGYPAAVECSAGGTLIVFYSFLPSGRRYLAANLLRAVT